MKNVTIYPAQSGGWIYQISIENRAVVIGWCQTREAAEHEARVA